MRLALVAAALAAFSFVPVHAHSWYSEKRDPVTQNACCGGTDCNKLTITKENLEATADGYMLHLSREEILRINPASHIERLDGLVTWERVQPSEDGNWHVCLRYYRVEAPENGVICLFAPPNI